MAIIMNINKKNSQVTYITLKATISQFHSVNILLITIILQRNN